MDHGYPLLSLHDLIIFVVGHSSTRVQLDTSYANERTQLKKRKKRRKRYAARIDALISRNDAPILAGGEASLV